MTLLSDNKVLSASYSSCTLILLRRSNNTKQQINETRSVHIIDIVACSRNHYCSEKAIVITYSECVFLTLGIKHAIRMGLMLSSVTCRLYSIFPHLMDGMIKKKIEHKTCLLVFSTTCVGNISHSKKK
jgi:hypothetical protein